MNSMLFSRIAFLTPFVKSKYFHAIVLLSIWLASSWALFQPGFFYLHDFVHAARAIEMLRALQDGQFPVRWVENFSYGFGMPLFQFYAPLPSYIGAFFLWLGIPTVVMLKLLWGICSAMSLLGSYLLGKRWFNKEAGLVMATLFTLFPYRAVNLFVRGALSEAWGMMWMPWVLFFALGVVRKQRWSWVGLVLFTTGLMLSHNLSTLMFIPLAGLIAVLLSVLESPTWTERLQSAVRVTSGFLVAGGLSAFYMLPAVVEKQYTQVDSILSGYFSPIHHFLYIRQFIKPFWGYGGSEWGPNDGISFFWGYGQWLGLLLAGVGLLLGAWMWWKRRGQKQEETAVSAFTAFCFGVCLMAVGSFFSLARSQWLWEAVPILSYIQFPWRWLSVVGVGISIVVGAGLTLFSNKTVKNVCIAVIILVTVATSWRYFRPEKSLLVPDDYYYTDPARIRKTMSSILPDYMPVDLGKVTTPPESLFVVPLGTENQVEVVVDDGHQKLFKTRFTTLTPISIAVAQYPGWYAELDGEPFEIHTGKWPGSIGFEVPPGEHLLGIKLGETPLRGGSDVISLVSALIVFGVAMKTSYSATSGKKSRKLNLRKRKK
jgi:hypothetical protein